MPANAYELSDDLRERIQRIRLLALDSDGVLTDGGVYVDEDGNEFRRFNIKDGLGLKLVMEAGIHVSIISGSESRAVVHRAKDLGIIEVHTGVVDKLKCLLAICERLKISLEEVAYMGDDLPDLPVLERVGLACTPTDAVEELLAAAHFVSKRRGGDGSVRELSASFLAARLETKYHGNT
jgi:3-deoxy-D-manno-octulosonate 8-phosphate phosphatase (KDO 8-P phosphatase)